MSSYRYQTPTPRTFNILPAGDYQVVITDAEEPYEKNAKQILKTTLTIQPSGHIVFYYAWSGTTSAGEYRDNIGELLLAANRAPEVGQEPNWAKLKGAKVKVRLKIEPDQNGEDRNVISKVYTLKQAGKPAAKGQSVSTNEFLKARAKHDVASGGGESVQDDLPYACDRS